MSAGMCRRCARKLFLALLVQPVAMRPLRRTLNTMKTCPGCLEESGVSA